MTTEKKKIEAVNQLLSSIDVDECKEKMQTLFHEWLVSEHSNDEKHREDAVFNHLRVMDFLNCLPAIKKEDRYHEQAKRDAKAKKEADKIKARSKKITDRLRAETQETKEKIEKIQRIHSKVAHGVQLTKKEEEFARII